MPGRRNGDECNQGSNDDGRVRRRRRHLLVRVLLDDGAKRVRVIEVRHVRYFFTGSAWLNGVIQRRWITELFRDASGKAVDWRDVPIHREGIYVRSEEGVFRLEEARSLEDVKRMVGGGLLQPHESVLINKKWIHDYSRVRAEIGVVVNGSEGRPECERVQVSDRNKASVETYLRGSDDPEDL